MGLIERFPQEFQGLEQTSLESQVKSLKTEEMEKLISSPFQQLPDNTSLKPILERVVRVCSDNHERLDAIENYLLRVWSEGKDAQAASWFSKHAQAPAGSVTSQASNSSSSVERQSSTKTRTEANRPARVSLDLKALFEAIEKGDLSALRALVKSNGKYLQARMVLLPDKSFNAQGVLSKDQRGCSALELAASKGNVELMRYLIEEGAELKDLEKGLFNPKEEDKILMPTDERRARIEEVLKIVYPQVAQDKPLIDFLEKLFASEVTQKGQLTTLGMLEFLKKLSPSALDQLSAFTKTLDMKNFDKLNVPVWLRLIREAGVGIIPYVAYFERLQAVEDFEKITPKQLRLQHYTNNYLDAIKALPDQAMRDKYEAVLKAHPKLIETFAFYEVPVKTFHAAVDFLEKNKLKTGDRLPDVVLSSGNYHMVRLPPGDYRALILGEIVNCCQSIDGHSAACVRDGMTKSDSGFYLLIRSESDKFDPSTIDWNSLDLAASSTVNTSRSAAQASAPKSGGRAEIIGQAYAWLSQEGGLVLDSWEELVRPGIPLMGAALLPQFATQIYTQAPGLTLVGIGLGGQTPASFALQALTNPHTIPEGYTMYGDAKKQGIVLSRESALLQALMIDNQTSRAAFSSLIQTASEELLTSALSLSIILGKEELKREILGKLAWPADKVDAFLPQVNLNKKDAFGKTPLDLALELRQESIAIKLIEQLDSSDQEGLNSALMKVALFGQEEAALKLLDRGGDINAKANNKSLLEVAAERGFVKLVDRLIKEKAKDLSKAFIATVGSARPEVIRIFLASGIDVNAIEEIQIGSSSPGKRTTTALLEACNTGNYELIKLLLEKGAKDNHTCLYNGVHSSALTMFAARGDVNGIKLLVEAGISVDTPRSGSVTPIHIAAYFAHADAVKTLLALRADKDATTESGDTPLMLIIQSDERSGEGFDEIIENLIKAGADLDKKNKAGQTALTLALSEGYDALAVYLLENGASLDASGGLEHLRGFGNENPAFLEALENKARAQQRS